jgi:hypothetical protein
MCVAFLLGPLLKVDVAMELKYVIDAALFYQLLSRGSEIHDGKRNMKFFQKTPG